MISKVRAKCLGCGKTIAFDTYADYKDYSLEDEGLPWILAQSLIGSVVICKCGTKNLIQFKEVKLELTEYNPEAL